MLRINRVVLFVLGANMFFYDELDLVNIASLR